MKIQSIYLTGCVLSLFLITSCTDTGEPSEAQSTDAKATEQSAEISSAADPFPPHQAFYNDLLVNSNCKTLKFKKDSITGPVNCTEFITSIVEFGNGYSAVGQLDYFPTKIDISGSNNKLIALIDTIAEQDRYGLVFHYGYAETAGTGRILYILSKGKLDSDGNVQFCPFEQGENNQASAHYFLLEPDGSKPFQPIDQTAFDSYIRDYFDNMRDNSTNPPSALDENTHARMVYHEPDSLIMFYDAFSSLNDLHLYINHGAVRSKNSNMLYHAPILTMGDDNVFYEIDDIENTPNVFVRKALDIGQLCPPSCAAVTYCN